MAENLWALREQKRLSVAALANRAGLPIGLIMEYESGQRSIDPRHLGRLARALYVEETAIKLQSEPRPGAAPLERQPARQSPPAPVAAPKPAVPRREKPPRPKSASRPPVPPRPSQLAHLDNLLKRLKKTPAELEAELGKPISSLDRSALSSLLKDLQDRVQTTPMPARHRAYLPEAVDEFEARYLTAAQVNRDLLHFTLFDGSTVDGMVVGFSPYTITLETPDGAEVTVNKLAIVCYTRRLQGEEPTP